MKIEDKIWKAICAVKEKSPLVLNITNFVVMNNTANALLAVGASPIMAHSPNEIEEMVGLCSATVINIGTLDNSFVEAMKLALVRANSLNRPMVLDPVGVGATTYRNATIRQLLEVGSPTYIRGNAGEIMTMAGVAVTSRGVDSTVGTDICEEVGIQLAREINATVSISGQTDIITDGKRIARISNGDQMMSLVTGLGCTASALLGAFAAVEEDRFIAATAAAALMAVAGEMAADESVGPGSLQVNLIDILYSITESQFRERLNITVE